MTHFTRKIISFVVFIAQEYASHISVLLCAHLKHTNKRVDFCLILNLLHIRNENNAL